MNINAPTNKGKEYQNKFTPCEICFSTYRHQIEALLMKDWSERDIAVKYSPRFKEYSEYQLFYAICKHFHHLRDAVFYFKSDLKPVESGQPKKTQEAYSIEKLASGLLKIGMDMVTYYEDNPEEAREKLKLTDVLNAQRVILEKQRVRIEENALKLGMARLFGGFLPNNIIEGEEVITHQPLDVRSNYGSARPDDRGPRDQPPGTGNLLPENTD